MGKRPEPRRILLDGEQAVVLSVREYENLSAARRQLGAHEKHLRAARRRLEQYRALVEALRVALIAAPHATNGGHEPAACLRCRLELMLADAV
jgi:hypothetical protein